MKILLFNFRNCFTMAEHVPDTDGASGTDVKFKPDTVSDYHNNLVVVFYTYQLYMIMLICKYSLAEG